MPKPTVSLAREYAFQVLHSVLSKGKLLDECLEDHQPELIEDNDRALAREISSGTCRQLGKIQFALHQYASNYSNLPPKIQRILELSTYQILFLDRVPSHAVVSDAVNLAKKKKFDGLSKVVNGILRNLIRKKTEINYPAKEDGYIEYLSTEYSHPEWIIQEWRKIWDDNSVEEICRYNNSRAPLSLKIRGDISEAKDKLQSLNLHFEEHPLFQEILILDSTSTKKTEWLQDKLWIVQDPVMTLPAKILQPLINWKIWDVCAAPGGKTIHLADLMKDTGTIIASDKSAKRLQTLQDQLNFLNIRSVKPLVFNPLNDTLSPEFNDFDAILLDIPCTGWGTFRRKPDLRWRLNPEDSSKLGDIAFLLLQQTQKCLKPGGTIVYSTCTLSPKENEQVVERFLIENHSYLLENVEQFVPKQWHKCVDNKGRFTAFPPFTQSDGAFCVRLRHTG